MLLWLPKRLSEHLLLVCRTSKEDQECLKLLQPDRGYQTTGLKQHRIMYPLRWDITSLHLFKSSSIK